MYASATLPAVCTYGQVLRTPELRATLAWLILLAAATGHATELVPPELAPECVFLSKQRRLVTTLAGAKNSKEQGLYALFSSLVV